MTVLATELEIQMLYKCWGFFKFYILGTIQANYIHYKMINIFLCCNGRPLLGSHLNWWEVIQRQPGDCVIEDKLTNTVKVFLFPFVYRLYTGDKLRSLPNDQPELIGAEEIIFHPFSPLAMNNQLWLEKLHRSIPVFASETAKL